MKSSGTKKIVAGTLSWVLDIGNHLPQRQISNLLTKEMLHVEPCDSLAVVIKQLDVHLELSDYTTKVGDWFEYFTWALFTVKQSLVEQYEKPLVVSTLQRSGGKSKLLREYRLHRAPASLLLELGLPEGDEGIDMIAKRRIDGRWVAIQVKYVRNQVKRIAWKRNLATFEALVGRSVTSSEKGIVGAILVTTSFKKTKLSVNASVAHMGPLEIESTPGVLDAVLRKMEDLILPSLALVPRAHQVPIIDDVVAVLQDKGFARLVMPTGSGKTLVSRWVSGILGSKSLFLVPSLALLGQSYEEWTRVQEIPEVKKRALLIGSDVDVHAQSVFSIAGTTSEETIGEFLRTSFDGRTEVYCTYQSSRKLLSALGSADFRFDLAVFDEAHRTAGAAGLFNEFLRNGRSFCRHMLFQTATERHMTEEGDMGGHGDTKVASQKGVGSGTSEPPDVQNGTGSNMDDASGRDLNTDAVSSHGDTAVASQKVAGSGASGPLDLQNDAGLSMDDEAIYGPLAVSYPIGDAISDGVLCDYRIVAPILPDDDNRSELISYVASIDGEGVGTASTRRVLASAYLLLKEMSNGGPKRVLAFCGRNSAAELLVSLMKTFIREGLFPGLAGLHITSLSGKSSASKRNAELSRLTREKRGVIASARIFREGVNVPSVDAVCFASEMKSSLDLIQTVGRGLRMSPGKDFLTVILPSCTEKDAIALSERIISAVEGLGVTCPSRGKGDGSLSVPRERPKVILRDEIWTSKELGALKGALILQESTEQNLRTFSQDMLLSTDRGRPLSEAWDGALSRHPLAEEELLGRRRLRVLGDKSLRKRKGLFGTFGDLYEYYLIPRDMRRETRHSKELFSKEAVSLGVMRRPDTFPLLSKKYELALSIAERLGLHSDGTGTLRPWKINRAVDYISSRRREFELLFQRLIGESANLIDVSAALGFTSVNVTNNELGELWSHRRRI